jgi:hypothetical protein
MPLSSGEIDLLISKLRDKYAFYAGKYTAQWFNLQAFEERLEMAIENRMNLEGFILAEIKNFEDIRERYEKRRGKRSFSEKIDKIIEENTARIKKYPPIHFHPAAGFEISHLYGALSDFTLNYIPIFWVFISEPNQKKKLQHFEEMLNDLAIPRGKREPPRIEDHILILSRIDLQEIDIERDKNNYLKESAFILHNIIDFCEELLSTINPEWGNPLQFDSLYLERERKKRVIENFKNNTSYGAILTTSNQAQAIIDDFRLGAFRRK